MFSWLSVFVLFFYPVGKATGAGVGKRVCEAFAEHLSEKEVSDMMNVRIDPYDTVGYEWWTGSKNYDSGMLLITSYVVNIILLLTF